MFYIMLGLSWDIEPSLPSYMECELFSSFKILIFFCLFVFFPFLLKFKDIDLGFLFSMLLQLSKGTGYSRVFSAC